MAGGTAKFKTDCQINETFELAVIEKVAITYT
jgi:hypothetical protein